MNRKDVENIRDRILQIADMTHDLCVDIENLPGITAQQGIALGALAAASLILSKLASDTLENADVIIRIVKVDRHE